MALMDFIKKQFIDVIHWTEESNGVLAWRYPMQDMEIQNGAQLTVRETYVGAAASSWRENLRAVRSQLMLRWFNSDPARKVVALVSPGLGEGRSFVAANLAIVFSQQGERTLLIDADLRQSRQQSLFMLGKSAGLSGILAEQAEEVSAAYSEAFELDPVAVKDGWTRITGQRRQFVKLDT